MEPIYLSSLPSTTPKSAKLYEHIRPIICTKFRILELEEYDKVLFMDADMLIIKNIEDLFLMKTPAGCFAHQTIEEFVRHKNYPKSLQDSFLQDRKYHFPDIFPLLPHKTCLPPETIKQAMKKPRTYGVQGGLILLRPNKALFEKYCQSLDRILHSFITPLIGGVDELSITLFLAEQNFSWYNIDMSYNVIVLQLFPIFKEKNSNILHFVRYKPWLENVETLQKKYPTQVEAHLLYLKFGGGGAGSDSSKESLPRTLRDDTFSIVKE